MIQARRSKGSTVAANTTRWFSERFELSRGGGANNIRPMEGLRGFAALLVFVAHYVGFVKPFMDRSTDFAAATIAVNPIGSSGVDLFFVLSGYLIYGSLLSRPQVFTQFMSRRITRIYPVFIVMFLIYVPLSFLFPSESKIPATAGEAIPFLLGNFFLLAGLFPITVMISVAWSLSYEMFYYAVIPAITSAFALRERSVGWRIGFFSVVAVSFAVYCAVYGGKPRLIMFIAGILLYEAINHLRLRPPGSVLTVVVVAAGLLVQLLPGTSNLGHTLQVVALFVSFFTLCFCCFANSGAWLRRAFEWTPLRWFGNMSYSFYMVHALVMQFVVLVLLTVLPPAPGYGPLFFWTFMPALFVAALIPAVLMYLYVERPFSLKKPVKAQIPDEGPTELPTPVPTPVRTPFAPPTARARNPRPRNVYAAPKQNPGRGADRD